MERSRNMKRDNVRALMVAAVFGGCIGAVFGVRRIDHLATQDYYWLWLGLWIVLGAILAGLGALVREMIRRR
jgi:uncharacterized membrane protein YsdA (DUF1294 family)